MASSSTSQAKGGRRDGKSNGKDGRAVGAENQSGNSFASSPPPPITTSTRPGTSSSSSSPTHEAIARRAYELYEQEGCQPGREVEYWLRAEAELTS